MIGRYNFCIISILIEDTDKHGLHRFAEVFNRINETELSRKIGGDLFESVPSLK
jgi:hypothetical protein